MVGRVSSGFEGLAGVEESFGGDAMTGWSAVIVVNDANGVREHLAVVNDRCLGQRGKSKVKSFEGDVF